MYQVLVIGGGAAGIAAALTAAREAPSASIAILEGLDRVGKKLLATGNGKCNLTNGDISPELYHSRSPELLQQHLEHMPVERTLDFFESLGLLCDCDSAGRYYPSCRQASMVLDVLLLALKRAKNIEVFCGQKVTDIMRKKGRFIVKTENGSEFEGRRLILSAGGKAAPKQGSDGSGYGLAKALGHTLTPLYPCLVPMRCEGSIFKSLKGIRVLGSLSLYSGKKRLGIQTGEIQFTDYGVSGIPTMQLSCLLGKGNEVSVDFFPDWTYETLRDELKRRFRQYGTDSLEDTMLGLLHKRVQFAILKTLNLSPTAPAKALGRNELEALTSALKGWRFPVTGVQGWEYAQVTGGGVPLGEVKDTFESCRCPGLYLVGELLDVTGDCGGYNLHWAWCSGMTAGKNAAVNGASPNKHHM